MNGFGMEGAKAMGQALTHNRTLLELDICNNRIPLNGVIAMAKGLNTSDSLATLRVSGSLFTLRVSDSLVTFRVTNSLIAIRVRDSLVAFRVS